MLIPGGGFASVGLGMLATGAYLFAVIELILMILAAYTDNRDLMLIVTAMLGLSLVMVTIERIWVRIMRGRGARAEAGEHWMLRYGLAVTMLPWVLGAAAVWAWVSGYAFLVMQGDGMEPSVRSGDIVLVRKRNATPIQRGDILLVRAPEGTAVGQPGELVLVRAAAIGGDVITRQAEHLIVNGDQRHRATANGKRWAKGMSIALDGTEVPADSIFVMQDNEQAGLEGREIGWVGLEDVSGDRLYRLNWSRLFEVVE